MFLKNQIKNVSRKISLTASMLVFCKFVFGPRFREFGEDDDNNKREKKWASRFEAVVLFGLGPKEWIPLFLSIHLRDVKRDHQDQDYSLGLFSGLFHKVGPRFHY